jgi:hypothetical protein
MYKFQIAQIDPDTQTMSFYFSQIKVLMSPNIVLLLLGIFVFLLTSALVIQAINKVLNYKRTMISLLVCLMIVSVPLLLRNTLISTFQLEASPLEDPGKIEIRQVSKNSIQITWNTSEPRIGALRYSQSPFNQDKSHVVIADNGKITREHLVLVEQLEPNTDYEAEILSGKNWYDDHGKPLQFKLN